MLKFCFKDVITIWVCNHRFVVINNTLQVQKCFVILLFITNYLLIKKIYIIKNIIIISDGNLIERLKRSPYFRDPEAPPYRPYWPPPPPPTPYWHHYHHGTGRSFERTPFSFPGPGPSFSGSESPFNRFEPSRAQRQTLTDSQSYPSNEPCKSCKGKNAAVSNSESVNGDSISIAISRSK